MNALNLSFDTDNPGVLYGFLQSLKADSEVVPQIMPQPLPNIFFLTHYLLTIPPFATIQSQLLTALLRYATNI